MRRVHLDRTVLRFGLLLEICSSVVAPLLARVFGGGALLLFRFLSNALCAAGCVLLLLRIAAALCC